MESRTKLLLGILAFIALFAVWTWIGPSSGGAKADAKTATATVDEEGNPIIRQLPGGRRTAAKATVEVTPRPERRFNAGMIRPKS